MPPRFRVTVAGEDDPLIETGLMHLALDTFKQAVEDAKERPDVFGLPRLETFQDETGCLYQPIGADGEPFMEPMDEESAHALVMIKNIARRADGLKGLARVVRVDP